MTSMKICPPRKILKRGKCRTPKDSNKQKHLKFIALTVLGTIIFTFGVGLLSFSALKPFMDYLSGNNALAWLVAIAILSVGSYISWISYEEAGM